MNIFSHWCWHTHGLFETTFRLKVFDSFFFSFSVQPCSWKIEKNLPSVADKYIIVCSSVFFFCTVWDLPFAAPSRMHCRQSLEGRSHFLPPAVKYSVRPEIIWDSFQGLTLFKYAGNNGQGNKWSTASHIKKSRGFESSARVLHKHQRQ